MKILRTVLLLSILWQFSLSFANLPTSKAIDYLLLKQADSELLTFKSKVFEFHFLSDINQETAANIDTYVMKRGGVISCKTDIIKKTVTIIVDTSKVSSNMDFVFDSVRRKYLGPQDAPAPVEKIQHRD